MNQLQLKKKKKKKKIGEQTANQLNILIEAGDHPAGIKRQAFTLDN